MGEEQETEIRPGDTERRADPKLDERFRTLVEHIPGVATYLDRVLDDPEHSEPIYISPQVEDMFGYPATEWLGEGELWLQILHPRRPRPNDRLPMPRRAGHSRQ